jgi:hypothetical protein
LENFAEKSEVLENEEKKQIRRQMKGNVKRNSES